MQVEPSRPYRVILYGAGGYFSDREEEILSLPNTCIIGIADSNEAINGWKLVGFSVMSPSKIGGLDHDYVVITSTYAHEIKEELVAQGFQKEKIVNYLEYKSLVTDVKVTHYDGKNSTETCIDRVLIIARYLDFRGDIMAAFYAAEALKKRHVAVSIAVAGFDETFLKTMLDRGIDVWVVDNLESGINNEYVFMKAYNHIIINSYVMHPCINYFDSDVNIILWLHEARQSYSRMIKYWGIVPNLTDRVCVYGVSRGAADNFREHYPDANVSVMEYGIPDETNNLGDNDDVSGKEKIVMAVIGAIYEIKGQNILLDAIELLDDAVKNRCEFWIIGKALDNDYAKDVVHRATNMNSVKLCGELNHEELLDLYKKIDVVISSSIEDMLPIVVIEGMMFGKKCIIPDDIGLSEYVSDGREVLKYQKGNPTDLCETIVKLVNNYDRLGTINKCAREFYQRKFSMDAFSERLSKALSLE